VFVATREYSDPCGIARALDRVGERWALLIVRELMFGPKRFGQLRAGLGSISPNVLSQRLAEMEADGLIDHIELGPPVGATVYALTDQGRDLEPVLTALARWGSGQPLPASGELSTDALLFALKTTFDPAALKLAAVAVEVRLGSDRVQIRLSPDGIAIERGFDTSGDVTIETDPATLRAVAFAGRPIREVIAAGSLRVTGPERLARAALACFRRPKPAH
jgi:DNA-binding HxlR family transcriptional regulator